MTRGLKTPWLDIWILLGLVVVPAVAFFFWEGRA